MIQSHLPDHIGVYIRTGVCTTTALTAAAAWSADREHRFLVLEGHTGSGKSIAAAWAHQFARERVTRTGVMSYVETHTEPKWPVWCDARLVCGMVGGEWRNADAWAAFDRASVVVIDDVGTEDKADRMTALLERLCNVSSGRAVLTTNLDFETFSGRYGDRVQSRMVGSARWVRCADPDMRCHVPSGAVFAKPGDETTAELTARLRADEERRRQEAEWQAGQADREKWMAKHMDEMQLLMDKSIRLPPSDSSDDERREFLRKQVAGLKAVD